MVMARRRIVLDSTGKPREEVSLESLEEAVAAYLVDNPLTPTGETAVPDPGDLTLSFENALI